MSGLRGRRERARELRRAEVAHGDEVGARREHGAHRRDGDRPPRRPRSARARRASPAAPCRAARCPESRELDGAATAPARPPATAPTATMPRKTRVALRQERARDAEHERSPTTSAPTTPMLRTFAPSAVTPPSANRNACTARTTASTRQASHGPSRIDGERGARGSGRCAAGDREVQHLRGEDERGGDAEQRDAALVERRARRAAGRARPRRAGSDARAAHRAGQEAVRDVQRELRHLCRASSRLGAHAGQRPTIGKWVKCASKPVLGADRVAHGVELGRRSTATDARRSGRRRGSSRAPSRRERVEARARGRGGRGGRARPPRASRGCGRRRRGPSAGSGRRGPRRSARPRPAPRPRRAPRARSAARRRRAGRARAAPRRPRRRRRPRAGGSSGVRSSSSLLIRPGRLSRFDRSCESRPRSSARRAAQRIAGSARSGHRDAERDDHERAHGGQRPHDAALEAHARRTSASRRRRAARSPVIDGGEADAEGDDQDEAVARRGAARSRRAGRRARSGTGAARRRSPTATSPRRPLPWLRVRASGRPGPWWW